MKESKGREKMEVITETEVLLNILQRQNSLILDMQKHIDSVTRDFFGISAPQTTEPKTIEKFNLPLK